MENKTKYGTRKMKNQAEYRTMSIERAHEMALVEYATRQDLENRLSEWKASGKSREQVSYGMLNDGFQSLSGIPDDFCSAEDPADRARLYQERVLDKGSGSSGCGHYPDGCNGMCD